MFPVAWYSPFPSVTARRLAGATLGKGHGGSDRDSHTDQCTDFDQDGAHTSLLRGSNRCARRLGSRNAGSLHRLRSGRTDWLVRCLL